MRTLRLARMAAVAEGVRLRLALRRLLLRAILALIAASFALAGLALAHIAGILALTSVLGALRAVLVVLAVDVVLAMLLLMTAARLQPGVTERDAARVRDMAGRELTEDAKLLRALLTLLAHRRR